MGVIGQRRNTRAGEEIYGSDRGEEEIYGRTKKYMGMNGRKKEHDTYIVNFFSKMLFTLTFLFFEIEKM